MIAPELIRRGAKFFSKETAVIFQGEKLTFESVYRNSNRLANALLKVGLRKGNRVAFLLANSLQSVEIDFALLLSGIVRVPLNTRLSEAEHLHMIRESDAKAVLFTEEFRDRISSLKPQLEKVELYCQTNGTSTAPEMTLLSDMIQLATDDEPASMIHESDLATIQYTSGTTGKLKAAVHTQETWTAICNNILTCLEIQEGDVMLHAAPLAGFNPVQYLQTVHTDHPTTLNLVPTMIVMLLNTPHVEDYSFDSVRQIIYGASPMPREALRRGLELWGPKFIQYYGQTEAPLILTLLNQKEHPGEDPETVNRLLSCGRPVTTTSLKILGEDEHEVPAGAIGEICVKSSQGMVAYWKAPELTNDTVRDGWIHTRDMGYIDNEGYLFLVDRKSDMIITGGFNVYPREVEEVLYEHPAVMEVAVVGIPDDKWVESIKAFVVLRPEQMVTEEELIEFCRKKLASYKKPSSVEFVNFLPMSAVGKVVRRVLRDPYWGGREKPI